MRKVSRRLSRLILLLGLFGSAATPVSRAVGAQSNPPKTVRDFYLLMPEKYDGSSREEREEILGYTSDTTIDIKNGYISYMTHLAGEVFEVALFKRPDGGYVLAYNQDCDLEFNVPTKLYFLRYEDGDWTDVTAQLLPVPVNSRYKYKLPQIGTTIEVTTAKGAKLYELAWKNGKFEKR